MPHRWHGGYKTDVSGVLQCSSAKTCWQLLKSSSLKTNTFDDLNGLTLQSPQHVPTRSQSQPLQQPSALSPLQHTLQQPDVGRSAAHFHTARSAPTAVDVKRLSEYTDLRASDSPDKSPEAKQLRKRFLDDVMHIAKEQPARESTDKQFENLKLRHYSTMQTRHHRWIFMWLL